MSKNTTIKRTKLSNSQLKSEILTLFNSGSTGKTDLYGIIRTKHTLSRSRHFKMYDLCYSEWTKIKNQADSDATVQIAKEAATIGLKSKLQKQIHLQDQINSIQNEIDRGIMEDYIFIDGNFELVEKIMNAQEKAYLRKVIKEIYSELNKMEGDYAPTKTELSGKLELKPITGMIIK